MKIGIDVSCFLKNWEEDMVQHFSTIKGLGYDGVEIPIDPFNFDLNHIRQGLKDNNLECTCGAGLSQEFNIFSPDEDKVEKGVNYLKQCIDIASQLNSPILCGVLFAPWGVTESREGKEVSYNNSIKSLKIIGDYAKLMNVKIGIEIINRYESSFLNTLKEGRSIIDKIKNSNVRLHFDSYHANIEEKDIYLSINESKNYISHVHFSDNDRGFPGNGHIDFSKIIKALKEINYDDWIVLECFVQPNGNVGSDTFTWRYIESSAFETAKKGIENVKKLIDNL